MNNTIFLQEIIKNKMKCVSIIEAVAEMRNMLMRNVWELSRDIYAQDNIILRDSDLPDDQQAILNLQKMTYIFNDLQDCSDNCDDALHNGIIKISDDAFMVEWTFKFDLDSESFYICNPNNEDDVLMLTSKDFNTDTTDSHFRNIFEGINRFMEYFCKAVELSLLDIRKYLTESDISISNWFDNEEVLNKFLSAFNDNNSNFGDMYCRTLDDKYNITNSKYKDYLDIIKGCYLHYDTLNTRCGAERCGQDNINFKDYRISENIKSLYNFVYNDYNSQDDEIVEENDEEEDKSEELNKNDLISSLGKTANGTPIAIIQIGPQINKNNDNPAGIDNSLSKTISDSNDFDISNFNEIQYTESLYEKTKKYDCLSNLFSLMYWNKFNIKSLNKNISKMANRQLIDLFDTEPYIYDLEAKDIFNKETFMISIASESKMIDTYQCYINEFNESKIDRITDRINLPDIKSSPVTKQIFSLDKAKLSINIVSNIGYFNITINDYAKKYKIFDKENAYEYILSNVKLRYDINITCLYIINGLISLYLLEYRKNNNRIFNKKDINIPIENMITRFTMKDFINRTLDDLIDNSIINDSNIDIILACFDKYLNKNKEVNNPNSEDFNYMIGFPDGAIICSQVHSEFITSTKDIADTYTHNPYGFYIRESNLKDIDHYLLAIESYEENSVITFIEDLVKIFKFAKCLIEDKKNNPEDYDLEE